MNLESRLKQIIRDVSNFPKEGIVFKDITPLLADAVALDETLTALAAPFVENPPDLVAGVESRGFIFGTAVAAKLGAGFIPIRKPGKLPARTLRETYDLEYGTDTLEIHADALKKGTRILLCDDLLATGGTALAAVNLLKRLEAEIVGISFVIELSFLNGRSKLTGLPVSSLVTY
jgi:adenine phosphoribosyltransferase